MGDQTLMCFWGGEFSFELEYFSVSFSLDFKVVDALSSDVDHVFQRHLDVRRPRPFGSGRLQGKNSGDGTCSLAGRAVWPSPGL